MSATVCVHSLKATPGYGARMRNVGAAGTETILCPYCNSKYQSPGTTFGVNDNQGSWLIIHHRCPSKECGRMVILLEPTYAAASFGGRSAVEDVLDLTPRRKGGVLWPKTTVPPIHAAIPKPFAELFREAWDVLPSSARGSAALARRCLQQLLHEHFKIKKRNLEEEIEALIASKALPSHVNNDLHAVRSVGNFAAHPQKNIVTGDIVDAGPDEAQWLLALLQAIFDSAFVEPANHAARKAAWNAKAASAGKPPV